MSYNKVAFNFIMVISAVSVRKESAFLSATAATTVFASSAGDFVGNVYMKHPRIGVKDLAGILIKCQVLLKAQVVNEKKNWAKK